MYNIQHIFKQPVVWIRKPVPVFVPNLLTLQMLRNRLLISAQISILDKPPSPDLGARRRKKKKKKLTDSGWQ
jgi:hypothetical protein